MAAATNTFHNWRAGRFATLVGLAAVALTLHSPAIASDPDTAGMQKLFDGLESAWRSNDETAFKSLYHPLGYMENLVGGSGLAGKAAFKQGARKGWFFKPDFKTLGGVSRGAPWLVRCDLWSWKKKRAVDRVWVLFATHKSKRVVIGAGEKKSEVEDLARRWLKKLPLRPPAKP